MPAGSPIVTRMEAAELMSALSDCFDVGIASEIAHILPCQRRDLLFVDLLLDLVAIRYLETSDLGHGLVATDDQLDAGLRLHRHCRAARLRLSDGSLHLRA